MPSVFTSEEQKRNYKLVYEGQADLLGYPRDLLLRKYRFSDWFESTPVKRTVPLAAFGQYPPSYSTACFAVLLNDTSPGPEAITPYRALGAPFAIEITRAGIGVWTVGRNLTTTKKLFFGTPRELAGEFKVHSDTWSAAALMRLKRIGSKPTSRQLDFFDFGLIPEYEEHVRTKLDQILREALSRGVGLYRDHFGEEPDPSELYRLTFSLLAAKILHDREEGIFSQFKSSDLNEILSESRSYYGSLGPLLAYRPTQQAIADGLWGRTNFANISVEILTYIWEHTFVAEEDRAEHGIYGTPFELARNLVYRLPDEAFCSEDRLIVEPCCGHGVFLVACMQRMRELLSPALSRKARHRIFQQALAGFDRDPFAVEVAKLCLSLADFPNRNGWEIHEEDVFRSNLFESSLRRAKTVLCNPPWKRLGLHERKGSDDSLTGMPAELLRRVLQRLPNDGLLGFVLPRKFTEGRGYKSIRKQLAKRFDEIEIVALSDKVFEKSEVESVLLVCKSPSSDEKVKISFIDVTDVDWRSLRAYYDFPDPETETKTSLAAEQSFEVLSSQRLSEVWDRLAMWEKVADYAVVHRGVEWRPLEEFPKGQRTNAAYKSAFRDRYTSKNWRPGFVRGLSSSKGMQAFFLPYSQEYVSIREEDQHPSHTETFKYLWQDAKVLVGAARGSRNRWRVKAACDTDGLVFSQRFVAVWPTGKWPINCLAAAINGPVASAFVATHEAGRDNRTKTIREIPLPKLSEEELALLDRSVTDYMRTAEAAIEDPAQGDRARRLLLRIDASLLKGYGLPPRLERAILDFFRGQKRPVAHQFGEYFPTSFRPTIPLWMYLSHDFAKYNAMHFLENIPNIDDPDLMEALSEVE